MNMKIECAIVASIIVNAVLENTKVCFQCFDDCKYFVKCSFRKHFLMNGVILRVLLA